jgi:hypothetical protein
VVVIELMYQDPVAKTTFAHVAFYFKIF